MSTDKYEMHIPLMDVVAGLRQSARIARVEQMPHTADRCDELHVHMMNAYDHMIEICPQGYTLDIKVVFELVPHVRATKRRD